MKSTVNFKIRGLAKAPFIANLSVQYHALYSTLKLYSLISCPTDY